MNSTQPNEPFRQLGPWAESAEQLQNVQRDDLAEASIEKSALDDSQTLMEEVVDEVILEMAWARVKFNRGSPGPDEITIGEFPEWFRPQWSKLRQQLIDGTYQPLPARRVSIDKPDGGTRELGIPNVPGPAHLKVWPSASLLIVFFRRQIQFRSSVLQLQID